MRNALMRSTIVFSVCFACGDVAPESEQDVVEIFSWWQAGAEVAALDALISLHEKQNPNTTVVNAAEDDAQAARQNLARRLLQGSPPDTFQTNVGQGLASMVLFNGRDERDSKVEALDDLSRSEGWSKVFPKAVLESASYGKRLYGVPLNIHRENALFLNTRIFEREELSPPETLDELYAVCDTLRERGVAPISFGANSAWPFSILLFEDLLLATAGGAFYQDYLTGKLSPDSEEILQVLEEFERLWGCVDSASKAMEWDDGVNQLAVDKAAMTIMGDWAKGELQTSGLEPGDDFQQIPFPGTGEYFVFTADTFPLPAGAPNPKGALRLLKTLASAEGQNTFNPIKGSIPARTDVDSDDYDSVARQTIKDFASADKAGNLILAVSGLAPSEFVDPVAAAIQQFAADIDDSKRTVSADSSVVLFALRNHYDILQ